MLKNITWGALTSRSASKEICHAAIATAQKVASRLNFDRGMGFGTTISKEGGTSRERKIKQQGAARQSNENKMQIAQNQCFNIVRKVCILIAADVLKQKVKRS